MRIRLLLKAAILICIFVLLPALSFGDTAAYFYDDAGRLSRVVKGTEYLAYQYDEVGNLLSIDKNNITLNPPVLNNIEPDALFIGSTILVSIKGQNLITTTEVGSVNPMISIRTLKVTDTDILTEMKISSNAAPGVATITVKTLYGQADIQAALTPSKLSFSPGLLVLAPGGFGTVTASIYPVLGRDVVIRIKNSSPSIVSAPQSLLIPSGSASSFVVDALKEGTADVNAGDAKTTVIVSTFTPEPGEEITGSAGPISVYIETPASDSSTGISSPASVLIETPPLGFATTTTLPFSIRIASDSIPDASVAALPVSLRIEETPATDSTTALSLPVGIYIEPQKGNSTLTSLPVSIKISP